MRSAFRTAMAALPVLVCGLVCLGGLARPLPAAAQATNFRQEWQDIKDSIPGLGQTRDPIDFTERAPLVVPPTNDLPPPAQAAPQLGLADPDMIERRKAMSDPRRPVPITDPGATVKGASGRTYLIDPPAGMRDPAAVAAAAKTDGFVDKQKRKKHVAKKRTPAVAEVQ